MRAGRLRYVEWPGGWRRRVPHLTPALSAPGRGEGEVRRIVSPLRLGGEDRGEVGSRGDGLPTRKHLPSPARMCSGSVHVRPAGARTLNACLPPETGAARRARHLAMLRELAELGMTLARAAADRALAA